MSFLFISHPSYLSRPKAILKGNIVSVNVFTICQGQEDIAKKKKDVGKMIAFQVDLWHFKYQSRFGVIHLKG